MTPILVEPGPAAADLEELTLDGLALHAAPWTVEAFDHKPAKKLLELVRNADTDGAKLLRLPKHETAEINLRLRLDQQASMDGAIGYVGALVDKLQEAERLSAGGRGMGMPLVWSPRESTFNGTFYVLAGEIEVPKVETGEDVGWTYRFPVVNVALTCSPFLYGAEVTTATTTASLPVITMDVANVPGDVPAEMRLIVTDMAGQSRDHLTAGLENFYHDPAAGALSGLLATAAGFGGFVTAGFAGSLATKAGSYAANTVRATLSTTPVAVCGSSELTHKGGFRNRFRLWPSSTGVSVRLAWRQGRDQWTTEPWQTAPFEDAFWEVDLGGSRIRPALLGTQTWQWRLEAKSTVAGETIDVDFHALVPSDEGYGRARSLIKWETPTTFSAQDGFDQTAGVLTGKTLPIGGTWAGSGDVDDFSVEGADHYAYRTAVSDADGLWNGRVVTATPSLTGSTVEAKLKVSGGVLQVPTDLAMGLVARYTDQSNYLAAYMIRNDPNTTFAYMVIVKRVAASNTNLLFAVARPWRIQTDYRVRLQVATTGRWAVWLLEGAEEGPAPFAQGQDAALATGGALASGKVGLVDWRFTGGAVTRRYDDFAAWVPTVDTALNPNQSAEFRSYGDDPILREDSTGTYWGRPPESRGGRLWLPPKGSASRTTRVAILSRRADIETQPSDGVTDSTSVAVAYRPRWLAIPRQA